MTLDAAYPIELGQERPQRMPAVQFVSAIRRQEQHVREPGRAHQEADQVTGGPVCPVQVLDHEDQRPILGEPVNRAATRSNR